MPITPTPVSQLPRASFKGIEFPIESCILVGGIRDVLHEYVKRPSGQPEKNGRRQYICRMRAMFDTEYANYGDLWPDRLTNLRGFFELQTTASLMIPQLKATIQAYCSNWTQTLSAAIQSGERVELEFKEDSDSQFLVPALLSIATQKLDSTLDNLAAAMIAINASNDKPMTSLFAGIASIVSSLDAIQDQTNLDGQLFASKIDGLISLCGQAANTVSMQNAKNWPAFDALQALWLSAVTTAKDLKQNNIAMSTYTTPAKVLTLLDVSSAIYGDTSHTSDLLQLNAFPDAFAILPGTKVNYYAST